MQIRGLVFGAAALALSITSASATMRISEDRGGQIGRYLEAFASVRSSGERVVVDGNCLSACTLVLGVVPRERICATQRARFGFHAAWMPDREGSPVTSPLGTPRSSTGDEAGTTESSGLSKSDAVHASRHRPNHVMI